eukprot:4720201-Pyramimonas_sp.AAC.1
MARRVTPWSLLHRPFRITRRRCSPPPASTNPCGPEIAEHIQKLHGDPPVDWQLSYPQFFDYILGRAHSMAGPDGAPHEAWKAPAAARALSDAHLCLLSVQVEALP